MEDRFKFRYFNKSSKRMYYGQGFYLSFDNQNITFMDSDKHSHLMWKPDVIIMQCTGLKDINGKLIYEGDIVQYICDSDYCADGYNRCYPCCNGDKKIIFFDENEASFKYMDNDDDGDFYTFDCEIDTECNFEIIGNLCENQELLKGVQNV